MNIPNKNLPRTHGEYTSLAEPAIVRAAARIGLVQLQSNSLRCLLVQHPKKGWEFPGGAVAPGEDANQAVLRELKEEAGILLDAASPLQLAGTAPITDSFGGCWIDIIFYTLIPASTTLAPIQKSEFKSNWLAVDNVDNAHTKAIWSLIAHTISTGLLCGPLK